METCRASRALLFACTVLGWAQITHADAETRTRVTIRGTGSDVSIDRAESPAPSAKRPELSRRTGPTTVLSEAIHMKEAKASDDLVVSYLKENASRLPIVVDLDTVTRLRAAGAGKSVLRYLASVSAIEVGESGAAGAPEPSPEYRSSAEPEEPGYAAQYGYPVFGGYSAPSARPHFHPMRRPEIPRFHAPVQPPPSPAPAPQRLQMGREPWPVFPQR